MIEKENIIDAVVCKGNETVLEVSQILRDTQRRHIIVINDMDKPIGLISTVDLNNRVIAEGKNPNETLAENIMTPDIKYVSLDSSYQEAFDVMAELGTFSIPVVEDEKIIGLLEFNTAFRIKKEEKDGSC